MPPQEAGAEAVMLPDVPAGAGVPICVPLRSLGAAARRRGRLVEGDDPEDPGHVALRSDQIFNRPRRRFVRVSRSSPVETTALLLRRESNSLTWDERYTASSWYPKREVRILSPLFGAPHHAPMV